MEEVRRGTARDGGREKRRNEEGRREKKVEEGRKEKGSTVTGTPRVIELPGRTGVAQVRLVHGLRDKEPQEIPILPYTGAVRSLSRPKNDTFTHRTSHTSASPIQTFETDDREEGKNAP